MSHSLLAAVFVLASAFAGFSQRLVSPEVQADGGVTFRLHAPDAKEVKLSCEGVPTSVMQKDDRGDWSFTTAPLDPDIYTYSFAVDGQRLVDPSNPFLKYNLLNIDSQVRVPGPASLPWEINNVPHGQVHRHFYHSAAANDDRDFYVYTPPGYNPAARKKYPVLYLLHGFSDDATAWVNVGQANVILDNLIARQQARPMLVVMPLGYGTMDVVKSGWGSARRAELWQTNLVKFRATLLDEVLPQIERNYRVASGADNHAIAGLSMGGAESLVTGLNALNRFAWIGAFSSGGLATNYPAQFPLLDRKAGDHLRLLWIACGKQDRLFANNVQFVRWLDAGNIGHLWVETEGEHNFRVWRRNLAAFAPLLFQEKPQPTRAEK